MFGKNKKIALPPIDDSFIGSDNLIADEDFEVTKRNINQEVEIPSPKQYQSPTTQELDEEEARLRQKLADLEEKKEKETKFAEEARKYAEYQAKQEQESKERYKEEQKTKVIPRTEEKEEVLVSDFERQVIEAIKDIDIRLTSVEARLFRKGI